MILKKFLEIWVMLYKSLNPYYLFPPTGTDSSFCLVFVLPPICCNLEEFTYITDFFFVVFR